QRRAPGRRQAGARRRCSLIGWIAPADASSGPERLGTYSPDGFSIPRPPLEAGDFRLLSGGSDYVALWRYHPSIAFEGLDAVAPGWRGRNGKWGFPPPCARRQLGGRERRGHSLATTEPGPG